MALSELQAIQLSNLLAGHSKVFTANNPGQNEFANFLLQSGQAAQQGLLAEEEEKKRKKEKKGALGGKIGSALGTAAGIALAPATGGASLAAAGALGGGLGGVAGQALAGGSPSGSSFALDATQGGLQGYTYGKQGELAESVETATTQPDIPASPTDTQKVEGAVAKAMPPSDVLSPGTIAPGALANVPPPQMPSTPPQGAMVPPSAVAQPPAPVMQQPGAAGVATASPQAQIGASGARRTNVDPQAKQALFESRPNSPAQPGFGSRFGSALAHVFGATNQQSQQKRVIRFPDGREVPY